MSAATTPCARRRISSRPVALLGDTAAFRLNVLAHRGEVADRNGARMERFGIAPSFAIGIGTDTQATFGYMKQTSDDRPDYGLPWLGNRPAPVERDRFYGFDSDYLETDADILSTQVLHRVSDTIRFDIQARYADYDRENRITEPLITPVPPAGTPPEQMSVYRYVFAGSSDETLLTTQAVARFDLGADRVRHALVTGVELSRETSAPRVRVRRRRAGHELARTPDSSQPFTATSLDPRIIADTEADDRCVVCARYLEAQRCVAGDARRALGSVRHGTTSQTGSPGRRRRSTPAPQAVTRRLRRSTRSRAIALRSSTNRWRARACTSRPARRSILRRRACRS